MNDLITADQFENESPETTQTPVAVADKLITADEFECEYVTQEMPKVSDVVGWPTRMAIGVQEGMEQYEKVPAQLMVYMGNAVRQGSARAKLMNGREPGLYNYSDDFQYNVGNRLLNLGMKNLKLIQERQAKEAVVKDEKFDVARDVGAGAPSIIQSVLLGATLGAGAAGVAVGTQMLGQKTEQLVDQPETLDKPFIGFGDRGADKLVSQPLVNALIEGRLEAVTLNKFLKETGPFLFRTIKQTITEGFQEFMQSASESAVDMAFQTRDVKEIPDALVESAYSFVIGAALGGPTAFGFNTMNRNAVIDHFTDLTGDRKKAVKLADISLEGALDDITTILETESGMRQSHGEIFNKMYATLYESVEKSGALANMNDDQKASYLKVAANEFANQAVMQAVQRGVSVSEVVEGSSISVNQDGSFTIVGGTGQQELNQPALQADHPLNFPTKEAYVESWNLFHGTPAEIEGGVLKFGAGKQLKKGGYMGGHFLSDREEAAASFQFGGEMYRAKGDIKDKVFDINKNKNIFKTFIGKKFRNSDGEMETFTKDHYDSMFPDGNDADWSTVYVDVAEYIAKPKGFIGIKIKEHAGGVDANTYQLWQDEIPIKTKAQLESEWQKAHDEANGQRLMQGANVNDLGFYSQAEKAINELKQDKMAVSQAEDIMNGIEAEDGSAVVHSVDITPEMRESVSQGMPLFQPQQGGQEPRASITMKGNEYVIRFLKTADPSSIPHELAHFWLDNMFQYVKSGKAPAHYKARWDNISKFLGVSQGQETLTVEQQEKWAKSYEAYLYQGATPSPNLANEYMEYRKWLRHVYADKEAIGETLTPQAEAIFDSLMVVDKQYIENIKKYGTRKRTNKAGRDVKALVDELFVPLSTRLSKVDESLKIALRKYMFNMSIKAKNDIDAVKPFLDKMSKLNTDEFKTLDLALKNRDMDTVNDIVKRNGLEVEFTKMQQALEDIFTRAKDAGLDVKYLENYFPRKVQDVDDYLTFLRGNKDWTAISREIRNVEREEGRALTEEERAEVADQIIRGYGDEKINTGKTSNMKARKIGSLTADQNMYYKPSPVALIEYITSMNDKIETARFVGQGGKNLDESVGAYVDDLINTGVINYESEREVRKVIKAIIGKRGTSGAITGYKNFSYIYTMGSPISAITQLGDLAMSLMKNGYYETGKALVQRKKVTKEDIGLDSIAEEFSDPSKSGKAVNAVFNAVGLSWMDGLGKATILTGVLNRLSKQAKDGKLDLEPYFGDNAKQVEQDLVNKNITDDVKFLMFSELADVQPIALSEMPEAYVAGGNARLWYMLKSYTIKQLDVYHNEVFRKMKDDPVKGVQNLLRFTFALMLMGMSADALKDVLLGRPITLADLVMDNILKAVGFSKYTIYKAKREGALTAGMQIMNPPIPFFDDIIKDVMNRFKDEPPEVREMRIWNALPVVGKFYYWWFGGGRTMIEENEE
jgi:hypothetical protein